MAALYSPWQQHLNPNRLIHLNIHKRPSPITVKAFGRSDFEAFSKRVASGEAWKDVWRSANDQFEVLVYEAKKTAERIDRRYDVSVRFGSAVRFGSDKAREIDREFEIRQKWREISLNFVQNLPRYRKQLNDFVDTPLGRFFVTVFFIWFAISGWMFRFLIFATIILPFAGPFLIRIVANNFIIKGDCPACKRQFIGNKSQTVRCAGCGNIVWQPKEDIYSRGSKDTDNSKGGPDIIDVEFEEK